MRTLDPNARTSEDAGTFKSPPHKLIRFFSKSRDAWREKAKERLETMRKLSQALRGEEANAAYWKKRACAAEARLETEANQVRAAQGTAAPADAHQKKIGVSGGG